MRTVNVFVFRLASNVDRSNLIEHLALLEEKEKKNLLTFRKIGILFPLLCF